MASTVEIGRRAEQLACNWLQDAGFQILERNWRTRYCEIDIIALNGRIVHFVEVKYRRSDRWGSGFDYISRDKAHRLQRAAKAWLQVRRMAGMVYQIDVMSVSGYPEPKNVEHLPNAITAG